MVFQAHSGVDVEKTVTDTEFKIATNSKLFSILSDSIYTQKIDAVIRELCCNAFDAHVEARQDRPFQVTLPDEFMPEFRVRDFGLGLCESDMQMYTTYGESTKSKSNAYIGAFGIGAKSPFAYTNTFNVTSYHGGMARSYSMFVEHGTPRMTLLGEIPSDDPSGLEVFFSVAAKDIDEFRTKTIRICALMPNSLEVLNVPDIWREQFRLEIAKYRWNPAPHIGDGYMTSGLEVDINCKQDVLNIVQGNVAYEMHLHEISDMLKFSLGADYDKIKNYAGASFYIAGTLKVPNGTFVPHPSRERLTFDEITKETIKTIFSRILKNMITDAVDQTLSDVKSYYDLHIRLKGHSRLIAHNPRIKEFECGKPPSSQIDTRVSPVRNYDDWRRSSFACIQVMGEDKNFRFRSISQMSMYGDHIDRIYYSEKYPLSQEYRYRIICDKQKAESKNSIILTGKNSRLFTDRDIALFVDVQSLPKLTPQELAVYKKKTSVTASGGPRVTKEEVSFLNIGPHPSAHLYQETTDEILDFASKNPVYWVGSNLRYEFEFGGTTYKLKTLTALRSFADNISFFFEHYRKTNNIPKQDTVKIGVAVLPDGHELRDSLPCLVETLQEAIRQVVDGFMGETFYEYNGAYYYNDEDDLLKVLMAKRPDLLTELYPHTYPVTFR